MPADTAPDQDEDIQDAAGSEAPAADTGADEDVKAKFRDALAHKQSSHGAAQTGHEDHASAPRGHGPAQAQRMFRRKAGG